VFNLSQMNILEMNKKLSNDLSSKLNIVKEYGFGLNSESVLLDLGCSSGKIVKELCDHGYQAYGCGTRFINEEDVDIETMMKQGIIREIDIEQYKLPFNDHTFDFIFSHSVFEPVLNYSGSISEISRVLKPDGVCMHLLPSGNKIIEPNIYVPFATLIQSQLWLYFWTIIGIRNNSTGDLKTKEAAIRFYDYFFKRETNYLSKRQLTDPIGKHFNDVHFCENLSIKYSPRNGKYFYAILKFFPFVFSLYNTFRSRVILTTCPNKDLVPVLPSVPFQFTT